MKPTTLTHQRSNANPATSRVANLRMQIGHNLATSHGTNPTTLTSANPTSPSKETAKEENR